ncbi:MAG: hypothetical protein ACRCT8_04020 [Lacipirellulaceae bacterium]
MHARELVELAGLMCLRSKPLLDQHPALCDEALSEYWIASRCRLDNWGRALRGLGQSATVAPQHSPSAGHDGLVAIAEEIVLAEVLTRAVAAIALAHDTRHGRTEAAPIGRNALDSQLEARSRLRALCFARWPAESAKARHVRSLGKQADRWTDVLLAYIHRVADVAHLAVDRSRLLEFAYDSQAHGHSSSEAAGQLLGYSLRTSFSAATARVTSPDLNRRVAGAALGLFGPDAFDGLGVIRSPWMMRAERSADTAITLLEGLFDVGADRGLRAPERWKW